MTGDSVSNLPALVTSRRIKSAELARPMLGVRMIGDPRYDNAEMEDVADLMTRRAVQYAAAMVRKSGGLTDFEGVDAIYEPPATVIFIRADSTQEEITRFVVPERIMTFDPERPALPAPEIAPPIKPVRLQLSRAKGFSLQALSIATNGLAAVNCARPSKWGNPFKMAGMPERSGRQAAVAAYRRLLTQPPSRLRHMILSIGKGNNGRGEYAVSIMKRSLPDLRNKNLACWCPLDQACHCDVLLELANAPASEAS